MNITIFCVDAFTNQPFRGNPAAVVILDKEAPEGWMQNVAAEMNLAETAFVVQQSPGQYGLRWFTPTMEVDLCGHATLASAFALWGEGLETAETITFHTRSGALVAKRAGDAIALDFPAVEVAPVSAPTGLMEALGLSAEPTAHLGGRYHLIELENEDAVRALAPDFYRLKKVAVFGVIATAPGADAAVDFVSRFFAPAAGIDEDPVTGSAHCQLATYWARRLGKRSFSARQVSRRGGELHVRLTEDGRVILQGMAALVWKGAITRP